MTKICTRCRVEKDLESGFGIDRSRKDGHNPYCRECIRERNVVADLGREVYLFSHNGKCNRRTFSRNICRRLDRVERHHHKVYIECQDKVWRWPNFVRPVANSIEEWLVEVTNNGIKVKYLL